MCSNLPYRQSKHILSAKPKKPKQPEHIDREIRLRNLPHLAVLRSRAEARILKGGVDNSLFQVCALGICT